MAEQEGRFETIEEVAERLLVDQQTVRRWIKSGRLKAYKPGREYRILSSDLDSFLETRSFPKAGAPSEERRLLLALFGTWGDHATALHARFAHLLNELPDNPTPEGWARGREAISLMLSEFDQMQEDLARHGVGELMKAYLEDAANAGDDEIRRALGLFLDAQGHVFGELIPQAVEWVRRTDEADRGAYEMEQRFAEQARKSEESGLLIR